jgi:hypothetical protein
MPSAYAAMSHFEFFAELYALYHDVDNPAGRQRIPAEMATWLAQNTAADRLSPAMPAMPAAKKDFETIIRPKRRKRATAAKRTAPRKTSRRRVH